MRGDWASCFWAKPGDTGIKIERAVAARSAVEIRICISRETTKDYTSVRHLHNQKRVGKIKGL